MKALVLAGGSGTRLRPITHTSAKQLVPLANKPILFYGLEAIADAGIKQVGIIVGETADEVRSTVGDGSRWGLEITYIPQDAPLGLAHCVKIARDFLGQDSFVMYLGDNFIVGGITTFVEEFQTFDCNAQVLLTAVDNPDQFGVAELDPSGKIVGLEEKPSEPKSNLALVGIYLFDASIHDAVNAIAPSARGELEITDAIQWLLDHGLVVRPHTITGWWIDTGHLDDLLKANHIVLDDIVGSISGVVDDKSLIRGRVVISEGATLSNSTVRGPAIIGRNATITDAYIGPYSSIYDNVEIDHAEIENSIVLEGSRIVGVRRITDSLIGKSVEIALSENRPVAYRLMVGDHSTVYVP